jgi:hypothetical protein
MDATNRPGGAAWLRYLIAADGHSYVSDDVPELKLAWWRRGSDQEWAEHC